jgi:hypothetical protein
MTATDWAARARREASAILAQALPTSSTEDYALMVGLVAVGWLQGVNYGSHETLTIAEDAFRRLQADLA